MRFKTLILAAAPIALLAACSNEAEKTDDTATEEVAAADTSATGSYEDGPATALADAGDYSGTYSYSGDDGTSRNVTLSSSDTTYRYTDADGTEQTGTYTVLDDGYRFRIDSFYGGPGIFTIRDGWLVRLNDDTPVTADTVVTGERYQRGDADDAMFSRFPEPGSPVAPQGE